MASLFSAISGAIVAISEAIDPSNRIWINFNKHTFVGGDVITGTVEMDCLVPFTARGVNIKFTGYERVHFQDKVTEWEGEGSNRRAVERIHDHRQNKEFFKTTLVVYTAQGIVTPGHYSFPFTFALPVGLPGTYYDTGKDISGNHYSAMVLYKAKATVDVAFRHNLHNTVRLVVNEKFDQLLRPSYGENSKSFMFTKGNLQARVWMDKNAYIPGETVLAKLKANNTSVKPTRRINIKVLHMLTMHANGRTHRIQHTEHKAEYPGFEPCFLGVRWMPFYIPVGKILPTSEGHLVKSSYIFQVECDIPGAVDLQIDLPMRILAPQFLWSAIPPTPPNAPIPPNIQIRPPWQPDEEAPKCNSCPTSFGMFTGRTHCRHCAKVFCKKCTSTEIPIPKLRFKDKERVCHTCVPIVRQTGGNKYQSTKQVIAAWQATIAPPVQVVYSPPPPPQSSFSPPPPAAISPDVQVQQYASPTLEKPAQYAPPPAQYAPPPGQYPPQYAPPPAQYAPPPFQPPQGQQYQYPAPQ